MSKKVKIFLIDFRGKYGYEEKPFKVERLANTTRYQCGTCLKKETVDDLCGIEGYEVNIRSTKDSDF